MHSPPQIFEKTILLNTNKIEKFKLTIKIILKIVNNILLYILRNNLM